jgi:hypothetical protein
MMRKFYISLTGNSPKEESLHSASAQKSTVESLALPRNTSLKTSHRMFNQPTSLNLSNLSTNNRCPEESLIVSYPCLSNANSSININTDAEFEEIHLNIFTGSKYDGTAQNKCLNIDIHRKDLDVNKSSLKFCVEKCNSTLNISIGSHSMIIKKRKKRKMIILQRIIYLFSHKKKDHENFYSPEICVKEKYNLNNGGVNISNDDLYIAINSAKTKHCDLGKIDDNIAQQNEVIMNSERFFNDVHVFYENNHSNELDDYMNEIKSREKVLPYQTISEQN